MSSTYDFVVNARDMGVNVEGKNGRVEYIERASFSMELMKYVEAGQHSGFLCEVSCSLREETKTCYFRIQRALSGGVGKLLEDLNTTYGSGVLTCDYEGQEFKAFLKWLMRNYFRKCRLANVKDTFKAAVCIGRQPNSEVWIFGPDLQLTANGSVTTAESTSILWVKEVFNIEEGGRRRDQTGCLPSIRLPLYGHALYQVIKSLVNTVHDNLMAAIFTIAGMIIGFHYEAIVEILGYCPIPVVCGLNRLGKTKSARAALSLIGNTSSFYSSAKDRFIPRLCARTTLPPVLDDVKKAKQIEDIAVAFYNRGKDGTCFLESTPRTCPILTVNWEALDALNKDPRVFGRLVLIPFLEGRRSPYGIDAQQRAEIKSEEVFSRASSAIGMIVGLSQQLDHILKTRTQGIASILAQSLPELDDRCLKNYGLLISIAEKVIEMAEIEGLAPELATTFFKKKVYSSVMEYQVDCSNLELSAPESGEPLIANLLMKCITDYKIPIQQMLTCINPAVSFRMKANTEQGMYSGVAVALKWLLPLIRKFGGTHPPEDRMRQEIRTLSIGDTSDKKQYFNKFTNGTTITRAAGGVEVTARSCVLIKYEAFKPESRRAFRKAFGIAVAPAATASEAEQVQAQAPQAEPVQAQALANPEPAQIYSASGEPAGISASNPDPTSCEPTGTSATSANPDSTCCEQTGTDAASATPGPTHCELTGTSVASANPDPTQREPTGTSATSANPNATHHEPIDTSAASAIPGPTHHEPTGTSAASAIPDPTCEPTGTSAASAIRDPTQHEPTGTCTCAASVIHEPTGTCVASVVCEPARHEETGTSAASTNPDPTHREPANSCGTSAIPELTGTGAFVLPNCLDDSGISLEVESVAIADDDLFSTVRGSKRGSINDLVNRKKRKTATEKQAAEYKYCICKKQRSKYEEDGMVICENKSKKKENKCPGNRYFHLKCLRLTRVPKKNPWYCSTCKARLNEVQE